MDDFNYQLNETSENDAVQQWRCEFGSDVDRVLFGQDLLNSINCAPTQDTHSAFLNPINDILTSDMNFCEQMGIGGAQSMQTPHMDVQPLNSWGLQENVDVSNLPSFINLGDQLKCTDMCDPGSNFNSQPIPNQNSVLLPSEPNVEFPTVDCAFFGNDYSSTISQWLQNIEQQQYSVQNSQISQPVAQITQCYPDTLLNNIDSLSASTQITSTAATNDINNIARYPNTSQCLTEPADISTQYRTSFLPCNSNNDVCVPSAKTAMFFKKDDKNDIIATRHFENHNHTADVQQVPSSIKRKSVLNIDQNEWRSQPNSVMTPSTSQQLTLPIYTKDIYLKPIGTFTNQTNFLQTPIIPFVTRQAPDINNQKKHINLNPILQRKTIIQPPEIIVMHPLRTRKLLTTRRSTISSVGKSNSVINLSEYFDTSCINIPMIKERVRTELKTESRRKQKLHIIPGAEDLFFELEKKFSDERTALNSKLSNDNVTNEIDPYPETELPELDEIFKRKKKNALTSGTVSKKSCMNVPSNTSTVTLDSTLNNIFDDSLTAQQQSSVSFEEKVSVSSIVHRKTRRNLSIDKQDILYNSDSDSIESVIERIDQSANAGKSFKCQKCRKFFKTTRSLAIHTKRCASIKSESTSSCSEIHEDSTASTKSKQMAQQVVIKLARIHQDELIESVESENSEDTELTSVSTCIDLSKARPITRSQTRRSSNLSLTSKRSK